jgi:hypothetical protein
LRQNNDSTEKLITLIEKIEALSDLKAQLLSENESLKLKLAAPRPNSTNFHLGSSLDITGLTPKKIRVKETSQLMDKEKVQRNGNKGVR